MSREIVVPSPGEGGDIQPLLERAIADAGPGAVLTLPAGRFQLEGGLRVRGNRFKPLTLRGHGAGRTRLFKSRRSAATRFMISFEGRSDPAEPIWVCGIGFEGAPADALDEKAEHDDIGLRLTRVAGFTVCHCRFTSFGHAAVQVRHGLEAADGLVCANEFVDNHFPNPRPDPRPTRPGPSSLGYAVEVRADLPDPVGPAQWVRDPRPGSDRFVFIEGNEFSGHRHAVAGAEGGLYVFRRNTVGRQFTDHAVDAHGAGRYGNDLSTRFYEVYENRLTCATPAEAAAGGFRVPDFGLAFRGGEGVVFGNTVAGFPNGVRLAVEQDRPPGYPALFQIGWESATNHTPNPDPGHRGVDPPELYRGDLFLWDNRFDYPTGVGRDIHIDSDDRALLIEGRDFHRRPRPEYRPYSYPHPRAAGCDDPPAVSPRTPRSPG